MILLKTDTVFFFLEGIEYQCTNIKRERDVFLFFSDCIEININPIITTDLCSGKKKRAPPENIVFA